MPNYSNAQKAAYYRRRANANRRSASGYTRRIRGRGGYIMNAVKKGVNNYYDSITPGASKRYPYRRYGPIAGGVLGAGVGGFLGGPGGAISGAKIGASAGSILSKISGFGDYKITKNSLMQPDSVPGFKNIGPRSTIITHREFIQDVVSSSAGTGPTAFDNVSFRIQPGDAETFPWLSQVAQNYEQYQFLGLIFEYKTTSGSMSSTPQLGTVVMATQYNILSQPFINKQEMENYEFACSTVPSKTVIHPIECDPKQTQCGGIFNVQTSQYTANSTSDQRLYDLGRFNIATVGMPVAQETVGELWVSYQCLLLKPRLVPDSGSSCDHWQFTTGIAFPGAYFGTDPVLAESSDNFTLIAASGAIIEFNLSFSGSVCITYSLIGTLGQNAVDPTLTGSQGAVPLDLLNGNTTNQYSNMYSVTGTTMTNSSYWRITPNSSGQRPFITFSAGQEVALPTFGDLMILQISSDLDD